MYNFEYTLLWNDLLRGLLFSGYKPGNVEDPHFKSNDKAKNQRKERIPDGTPATLNKHIPESNDVNCERPDQADFSPSPKDECVTSRSS